MGTPSAAEKRVSWAELFFDLVFVFAVTEISSLLGVDHTWSGVLRAAVLFVPIYWSWLGVAVLANTQDISDPLDRIGIFGVGLAGFFMALAVPGAYGERGVLYASGYLAVRVLLAAILFRRIPFQLNPIAVGLTISGPLIFLGGFLHGTAREAVWAVAALIDLSSPRVLRPRLRSMHIEPGHFTERFGLLVLIAVGESVVAIGTPTARSRHIDAAQLGAVAAAFVLACGLWWVYFHFAADAMRYALTTAQVPIDIARHVLSYGHLLLIGAIIAVATGMREVITVPSHHLPWGPVGLLFGGCALYLATFNYTRWQMFRVLSPTRGIAALAVLALLPIAHFVSGLVSLSALATVLVALNVVEYRRVLHGRRGSPVPGPAEPAQDAA